MAKKPAVRIIRQYGVVQQHGQQTPVRIILHTTEGDTAAGAFATFKNSPQGLGAQYIIDADGTIYQTMPDTQIAYGTGGNNNGSISIEIVGHASYTAGQWAQRQAQINAVSGLMGYLATRYNIPMTLTPNDPHRHGVTTHAMNSAKYPASEGHTDPGPGFPLKSVLSSAAADAGVIPSFGGYGNTPTTTPTTTPTPATPTTPVPASGVTPPSPTGAPVYPGAATDLTSLQQQQDLSQSIANIPQPPGPPLAGAPLESDFNDVGPVQPYGAAQNTASTWAVIAQGTTSPDTLRLAQMAQYGANGPQP